MIADDEEQIRIVEVSWTEVGETLLCSANVESECTGDKNDKDGDDDGDFNLIKRRINDDNGDGVELEWWKLIVMVDADGAVSHPPL